MQHLGLGNRPGNCQVRGAWGGSHIGCNEHRRQGHCVWIVGHVDTVNSVDLPCNPAYKHYLSLTYLFQDLGSRHWQNEGQTEGPFSPCQCCCHQCRWKDHCVRFRSFEILRPVCSVSLSDIAPQHPCHLSHSCYSSIYSLMTQRVGQRDWQTEGQA